MRGKREKYAGYMLKIFSEEIKFENIKIHGIYKVRFI